VEASREKREHPRVKTHIPVRYRKLRDRAGAEGTISLSKNLSEGGVRFRTDGFVSRACRLILELDIPMFARPVKAISKVAWIKKSDSGKEYEIGNRFLEMTKEDRDLISEYIESLMVYQSDDDSFAGEVVGADSTTGTD
jgi:hypothetical protein